MASAASSSWRWASPPPLSVGRRRLHLQIPFFHYGAPPPATLLLRSTATTHLLPHPPRSAVQEGPPATAAEEEGETQSTERRRLYVANLPFSFSASDIQNLLAQSGATVSDVEIIKHRDGRSKGYAFVTVHDAADAVIERFDSYELLDRIIRVEYAKSLKKPPPPRAPQPPPEAKETRHLIYVSNLAWKVRSGNLREFFSAGFKPASVRVVFDSPLGKSAGYGFVSFSTEEEALAAISELDGKELMGRPLRLKMSEKNTDKSPAKQVLDETVEAIAETS